MYNERNKTRKGEGENYMKKLISLFLALLMLSATAAFAAETIDLTTYTGEELEALKVQVAKEIKARLLTEKVETPYSDFLYGSNGKEVRINDYTGKGGDVYMVHMEKNFAEQLIAARKAAGLTQEQLGEKMHMSRQGISHWENGRALLDAEMLKQLSQALGYDFVAEAQLAQPGEQPNGQTVPTRPAEKPFWKRPEFILSVAVTVLALLLLFVLLRPAEPPVVPVGGTQLTTDPVNTAVPHPVKADRAEGSLTFMK